MDSHYSFYGTTLDGPGTAFTTVRFTDVKANDITDSMSISIASINGRKPEEAGISRIAPMSAEQMQANKKYTIYNGAIRPASNERDLGSVTIPAELWGERVTAIASRAFENRGLGSVTIPEGVTTIAERAFADNHWTLSERNSDGSSYTVHRGLMKVTIPNSVTYIGPEAFSSQWTNSYGTIWLVNEITIGAKVILGKNAFGNGFENFYGNSNMLAGTYKYEYGKWERFESKEIFQQKEAEKKKKVETANSVYTVINVVGGIAVGVLLIILLADNKKFSDR